MSTPIPHGHISRRLRRSLAVILTLGVVLIGLLATTIGLVNYNISQTEARSREIAVKNLNALLQSQQKFSLPENTSYIPSALDDATLVKVVARNQPSVVRIVAIYCADVTFTYKTTTLDFTNTCSGRVGSGSFISRDGYIATSGHVVSVTPEKAVVETLTDSDAITKYLNYLVTAKLMTARDASILKKSLDAGSVDAQTALYETSDLIPAAQIAATNVTTEYAVQLSNQPIDTTRSGERATPIYTDRVIKAAFVDQNYDQRSSELALTNGDFQSSDVALLKAEGSFPYITLGSIDGLNPGDQLTAIGFPSAIDGVDSALTQKVPSITQGKVTDIRFDSSANLRKLISTTVPIGQGNSGGPALNDDGEEIGLNTYSAIECPDLKCYGNGQVRDIADVKVLLQKNNITLQTGGIIEDWTKALDSYTKGNYADALTYLNKVHNTYPANYLVPALLGVANQQVGTSTDTSTSYQTQGLVLIMLVVLVVAMVVITIIMVGLIIGFTIHFHLKSWQTDKLT